MACAANAVTAAAPNQAPTRLSKAVSTDLDPAASGLPKPRTKACAGRATTRRNATTKPTFPALKRDQRIGMRMPANAPANAAVIGVGVIFTVLIPVAVESLWRGGPGSRRQSNVRVREFRHPDHRRHLWEPNRDGDRSHGNERRGSECSPGKDAGALDPSDARRPGREDADRCRDSHGSEEGRERRPRRTCFHQSSIRRPNRPRHGRSR